MGRRVMRQFRINVFGMKTTVKLVPSLEHSGRPAAGLYSPQNSTIYIATENMSEESILHTFLHELFHSVFHRVGIYNCQVSLDAEEVIVDNLATVVTEILYSGVFEKLLNPKKVVKKKK
jgi:Zn-dependent peptidase ImmA (M78 family)